MNDYSLHVDCKANYRHFILELGPIDCANCSNREGQHVQIAVKVVGEVYQFLSETDVDDAAPESKDRISQLSRAKATSDATPSVEAVG